MTYVCLWQTGMTYVCLWQTGAEPPFHSVCLPVADGGSAPLDRAAGISPAGSSPAGP